MTTLATVLVGAPTRTTNTAPLMGTINCYNASGGSLAVTLPALASLNVGATCIVEKSAADATGNAITFSCSGGDVFDYGTSSLSLIRSGEKRTLQVVMISGTKYWKITGVSTVDTTPSALTGQSTLTTTAAPTLGSINSYNAASGALSVVLPALSTRTVGETCIVEKSTLDLTGNAVTFTAYGASGDTYDDGTTSVALTTAGEQRVLQVIQIASTKYWKVIGSSRPGTTLSGAATITTSAAPALGVINSYNATSGSLTPTLPALSTARVGISFLVEKNVADTTQNTVTFTAAGGDTFDDGSTTLTLSISGEQRVLHAVQIGSTKYWKVTATSLPKRQVPKRVTSNSSSPASITISTNTVDTYKVSALANALAFDVTGTPADRDQLTITIKDNGTSQLLSWSSSFTAMGVIGGMPASTPPGSKMTLQFVYDSDVSKWVLSAVDTVGY